MMELDVHIVREVNSAWGFTLVGGNDSEIPLTVIKVLPDSPADRAGLQDGDTVLRIEDSLATEMSHAVASEAVNAAEDSLVLGVVRGLYDPVLDDYEPIYEPVDQEDTDQPSDPTEEEILEIERKSSLLASEIDKTIKSIEEYKEEVGIEAKKEISMSSKSVRIEHKMSSSGSINKETKEIKDNFEKEWKEIEKQVQNNHKDVNELSVNVTIEEANGDSKNGEEDERVQIIEVEVSARNGHGNGKTENGSKFESHEEVKTESSTESEKTNGVVKVSFDLKEEKQAVKTDVKAEESIKSDVKVEKVSEKIEKIQTAESHKEVKKEYKVTENVEVQKVTQNGHKEIDQVQKVTENGHKEIDQVQKVAQNGHREIEQVQKTDIIENGHKEMTQKIEVTIEEPKKTIEEPKVDPMQQYRPVKFDPEEIARRKQLASVPVIQEPSQDTKPKVYMTDTGEIIGTTQGIVDGLEEAVVDIEVAKALGKPGMPDEKIAELISGEAEMLREAHVMGLARVLSTHMHRADDDSSVDFQKIKPVIESLKNSEVLKALNEEVLRVREEKKKEEKKWTTFLQKPKRPPPRPKYGYYRYVEEEDVVEEPYKVKIVKQPKPKVAPDYKPEDFDTGPLPWEQPQPEIVPGAPPIEPEEPILIPEEGPEFLEAVDPTPESEIPDLEDTGIPLPPPRPPSPLPIIELQEEYIEEAPQQQFEPAPIEEETEEDMDGEQLAEQLLKNVQKMVDPDATLEQQLAQMRAQIAALAQLPGVIQQTLDLVARQISQLSYKESAKTQAQEEQQYQVTEETYESEVEKQEAEERQEQIQEQRQEYEQPTVEITEPEEDQVRTEERQEEHVQEESKTMLSEEELARRKKQEEEMLAEQQKIEKQRKIEHWNQIWPWGNTKSFCRKYRINFMKYEKPPVSLDHLQRSEVYKVVHNLDETPLKRVETLTPVIAESDYRERVRSLSPFPSEQRVTIPPQLQP